MSRSNYKRLGDYIQLVDERNSSLEDLPLVGLSISKQFILSVANIIGTDLSNYKIIKQNQFACSLMQVSRDEKIPIAMFTGTKALMSPAYPIFEVIDKNVLLPEYLMMWFSRTEFDRHASYLAVGGVRGNLPWEDFCDMQLPLPHITKQREIVKEYNTIQNRINLNQKLIQNLEETAQAIYKQWFVEFEFPDRNCKPYKSNGGKMIDSELGIIPQNWSVKPFTQVINLSGGGTPNTTNGDYWNGCIPFFTPADVVDSYYSIKTEKHVTEVGLKNSSTKLYPKDTVFVTARGTVGAISMAGCLMTMNQSCYAITGANGMNQFFTHQVTLSVIEKLKSEAVGAVFGALVTKDFDSQMLIEPNGRIVEMFGNKIKPVYDYLLCIVKENQKLSELKDLLLSRLTQVGN